VWVIRGCFAGTVAPRREVAVRTSRLQFKKGEIVKRFFFSPLFSYMLWGTILVVSLAIQHQTEPSSVACATTTAASQAKPAA
jgi:hypothetical protein